MRIPEEIILEIKSRNPIESVISSYVNLTKAGSLYKGLCPFHSEKTPSFTVYPNTSSYYCFGCGAGGDAVTFIKNIENLDYIEALKLLADRAGVQIPENGYDDSVLKLKARLYEVNKEAALFYHHYMLSADGKAGYDYFTSRGLNKATLSHFALGFAPNAWDGLIKYLKNKGFTINEMLQAGLIVKGKSGYYDRFRNRTMFPILDLQNRVIGFSGRIMPGEENNGGKYVNTTDTLIYKKSHNLFGMNFAKANLSEGIILVEGNLDVITLHQAGVTSAVAALGTAFTDDQARLIARYTDRITLVMDSDAAGKKATDRALKIVTKAGLKAKVVNIPDGKDPDEFVKKNGKDAFVNLIKNASANIDYLLANAAAQFDINSDLGKIDFLNKAAEILSSQTDLITRDIYASKISEKYNIKKSVFEEKIKYYSKNRQRQQQKENISSIVSPKYDHNAPNPDVFKHKKAVKCEEIIISVLIKHPDFISKYEDIEKYFVSQINKAIISKLKELLLSGTNFDISYFSDVLPDDKTGYLIKLANDSLNTDNPAKLLADTVDSLKAESEKINLNDTAVSDDDWAEKMKSILDRKGMHNG